MPIVQHSTDLTYLSPSLAREDNFMFHFCRNVVTADITRFIDNRGHARKKKKELSASGVKLRQAALVQFSGRCTLARLVSLQNAL